MSITGGIKFFEKSRSDVDNINTVITVSSGESLKYRINDRVTYTKWQSVGSNDSTTETIEIDFGAEYDIDRILLIRNNFKAFSVRYDNSGWSHFTNVVTKEGTQTNITETDNSKETNYYEFDKVTTQKILISVDTTQTADAEKFLFQFIATEEIGTFTGYPEYRHVFNQTKNKKEANRGKSKFSLLDEVFTCTMNFNYYPVAEDHQLVLSLWDSIKEFYIYPCGANENQFRFQQKGFRLKDIYLVYFDSEFDPNYARNVYQLGMNYSLLLTEVL